MIIQQIDTAYCNEWFWNLVFNPTRYQKMNMFEDNSLHTILSIKIQDYVSIIEIRKQAEQKKTI